MPPPPSAQLPPVPSDQFIAEKVEGSYHDLNLVATSQNECDKLAMRSKTMLDLIPMDVCVLLPKYFSTKSHDFYISVGSLAQLSEVQRKAMVISQNFKVVALDPWVLDGCHVDYMKMFEGEIKEVKMVELNKYSPIIRLSLVRLLAAPTLHSACITADLLTLKSISKALSLSELCIKVRSMVSMRLLNTALISLNLKVLRLICDGEYQCMFGHHQSELLWKTLGTTCMNVSTLELTCLCPVSCRDTHLTSFITNLPNLKNLIFGIPDQEHILEVANLDSLMLRVQESGKYGYDFDVMVSIASRRPELVTGIELDSVVGIQEGSESFIRVPDREGILGLQNCTGLQVLHLGLIRQAEKRLPTFGSLQSLHLRWFEVIDDVSFKIGNVTDFYEPDGAFFERIVRTGTNLRSLGLFNVQIGKDDLKLMLKGIGERLEEFGTSVCRQEEDELERMVSVLDTLASYNPGLKNVLGLDTGHDIWNTWNDMSIKMEKRLLFSMKLLKRRAVDWDLGGFLKRHCLHELIDGASLDFGLFDSEVSGHSSEESEFFEKGEYSLAESADSEKDASTESGGSGVEINAGVGCQFCSGVCSATACWEQQDSQQQDLQEQASEEQASEEQGECLEEESGHSEGVGGHSEEVGGVSVEEVGVSQ